MRSPNLIMMLLLSSTLVCAQRNVPLEQQQQELTAIINQYSLARENKDTVLLKAILADDVDQLVSTGEWRTGIRAAVQGMLASSSNNPGDRALVVKKIKLLSPHSAVVDCRYEIANADGSMRRMWSSFVLVADNNTWKISSIRNMLPATR